MWYISDEWRMVLEDCAKWRELAILQVNDPGSHPIGLLADLGQRIAAWCDANTHIDPSPLTEIWRLAEANQPAKYITKRGRTLWQHNPLTFGGKPAAGAMETAMWRAIDVLDRLYAIGTTQQNPGDAPPTPERNGKDKIKRDPCAEWIYNRRREPAPPSWDWLWQEIQRRRGTRRFRGWPDLNSGNSVKTYVNRWIDANGKDPLPKGTPGRRESRR